MTIKVAVNIVKYQTAFNVVKDKLEKNNDVLNLFVFGSMVNGDLWEGSDIDMLAVCKVDSLGDQDNIFTEVGGIPVHIKVIYKDEFMRSYNAQGQNKLKNILFSSKIAVCKDTEILQAFNNIKYLVNSDRDRWSLVYLSNILKDLEVCGKYIHNGGIFTVYEVLIRTLHTMCNLYLNLNGYGVGKDSLRMVCNLDSRFNLVVENLINGKVGKKEIEESIIFVEGYIEKTINESCKVILSILQNSTVELSARELEANENLKGFNIVGESLLKFLWEKGYINKSKRELISKNGNSFGSENVYSYKLV